MPQNSLVSIIIPFYNREKLLPETLNSVLAQSFSNWECILVDDNSSDKSTNVVKEFIAKDARFNLYYRNDTNKPKGVSSSRNIGINNAKGDYIVFLDSDDLLDINCLENRLKYADKEPENDIWVFSMQEFNDEGLGKICNYYPKDTSNKFEYFKMFLKYEIPFSVTCPLWKSSVLKELGGFDENFLRLEDPDLHCRALLSDFSFKFNLENK
ncbi:glycosyltransferase family 2 protein, partial [bacterium]|nr:glycosyltransferase family 2 protein [bacterium]